MSDDFGDHPVTIGELRANKSQKATDWTPRDALLHVLRAIDSGEGEIDALIIVARDRKGGGMATRTFSATADIHQSLGLLERAAFHINHATEHENG